MGLGTKRICSGRGETSNTRAELCLDDAFANPIPLEVAKVLHEEGMRYHSVITIVIQGANDFHPECQF